MMKVKSKHEQIEVQDQKSHSPIYFIISSHSFFIQCNTLQYQRNEKINLVREQRRQRQAAKKGKRDLLNLKMKLSEIPQYEIGTDKKQRIVDETIKKEKRRIIE